MKTTKKLITGAVSAGTMAVVFGALAVAPASAVTGVSSPTAVVSTKTTTNSECVSAVTAARDAGDTSVSLDSCTSTVTLSESPEETVTAADLAQARQTLSSTKFAQLQTAAAAGTVKKKNYSQGFNNITDKQSQSGTFYYDGSRAWVTQTYRGHQGTHHCEVNWSVGYVVEEKACSESGTNAQRDLYVKWHFSAIPSGGLVNWDESHTMHVNKTGRIWQ
jgi:hypothetical protein